MKRRARVPLAGSRATPSSAGPDPESLAVAGTPTAGREPDGQPGDSAVPARLGSLDAFRGLTIAGMLVVNTPGTWKHVYPPLLHAEWNGWTYTDTIFPFFLFAVGASIALSLGRRRKLGELRRTSVRHVLSRAVILFGIGLALNALSFALFHRSEIRIPGVLQRIAVCFLLAAALRLALGVNGVLPAAVLLLLLYWGLMSFVPVPGYGRGRLDVEGNLAASVDRALLGSHTWKHDPGWDPEGLLSTIPAIATTLFGIAAGELLRSRRSEDRKLWGLAAGGAAAVSLGLLWSLSFPINKNLWTSSYSLFMSGLAAISLALLFWVVDLRRWNGWTAPFRWLGANAIAIFVLSDLAAILLLAIRLGGPGGRVRSLYAAIYESVFDRFLDARVGSFLFALSFCALWIVVAGLLYRHRVFLKV